MRLAAGIKVLIRAKPEFSAQYGLTLHIDAIDPSYTLGDLEAKKRQIREQLKADGIFDRNRQLPAPWDYRALLVVSPPRAAGLGDFARDADRLQRHGLCEAVYAHSRFEGEGAPASIREAIEAGAGSLAGPAPARCDRHHPRRRRRQRPRLAQRLRARPIHLPEPGAGADRHRPRARQHVLDEVAHQRFDTPSKVVAGIQALIVKRARESQAAFDEVAGLAARQLRTCAGVTPTSSTDGIQRRGARGGHRGSRRRRRSGSTPCSAARSERLHDAAQGALAGDRRTSEPAPAAAWPRRASRTSSLGGAGRCRQPRPASARSATGAQRARATKSSGWRATRLRWGAEAAEATFREVVAQGPEKTLGRGFAVVHSATGEIVTSAAAAGDAKDAGAVPGRIDRASVRRGKERTHERDEDLQGGVRRRCRSTRRPCARSRSPTSTT